MTACCSARSRGEAQPAARPASASRSAERVPPGLAVLGHVAVAPAVGLAAARRASTSGNTRHPRVAVLPGQQVRTAPRRAAPLQPGEKSDTSGGGISRARTTSRVTSSQWPAWPRTSKPGEPAWPAVRLLPLVGPRRGAHCSRRRIAASSPIPPTMVTSSGASSRRPHLDVVTDVGPATRLLARCPGRAGRCPGGRWPRRGRGQRQRRLGRPPAEEPGDAGRRPDGPEGHRHHIILLPKLALSCRSRSRPR